MNQEEQQKQSELIQRLLNREQKAWNEFITNYQGLIFKIAFDYHFDNHEEILADMVIKLMDNDCRVLRAFKGTCTLGSWLYGVVRNHCCDTYRRKKRLKEDTLEGYNGELRIDAENIEDTQEAQEAESREEWDAKIINLREAVTTLPDEDKVVYDKVVLEQKPYKTVAQELGIPMMTVGTKLFRIKQKIRKYLEENGE